MTQKVAVTRLNVMLDSLCFEVLETDANGVVETSLGLNPGTAKALRRQKHVLELNQQLVLPETSETPRSIEQVTLWN